MIGKTVSHYRILERLGEGGMGVVYIAEDISLGRRVAVKTLTTRGYSKQQFRRRFKNEARLASRLSHPHIATVYDYGETDEGQPFLVMELVQGKTLNDLIRENSLTIPRTIEIVRQVSEALSEAHRHGLVHRDIKPSNIAINERGSVKVLDFGLAKEVMTAPAGDLSPSTHANTQTLEGIVVGTPLYLSPEQALRLPVDARSDLFSLGSVLYECITGRPAFEGTSDADICAKVIRDDPPLPSLLNKNISEELEHLTLMMLAKKPEARYQTADELIAGLNALKTEPDALHPPITRIKANGNTHSIRGLVTLSDIFKRPRLSIGYVATGILLILTAFFLANRWTRPTLSAPLPEAKQLYDKGLAALQEGSYFKASNHFERAVTIDNRFALAYARWAEALAELDRTDKSREEMLNASRLVKDRGLLDRANALHFEAIEATLARDTPAAINTYGEILKLDPTDSSYLDLGRAYENHDEVDLAIQQYLKATELNQNNPAPLLRLGVLYGRRQDLARSDAAFEKAETLYKSDLDFEGSAEVAYQRGYLLMQSGKMPDARSAAQRSLDVSRTANNVYQQVRALLLLSTISYSTGDTKQAEDLISQALALARRNDMEGLTVQGLLDLGYASMLKRSYKESEQYLNQAFNLAQQYKQKRNEARSNLLLGTLYIQLEQPEKGAPYIEQALSFYRTGDYRKEVSRCMLMIGREQLLKGDFDGAVKTLDEQLELAKKVEDPGQLSRSQAEIAAALSKQDLYPQALVRYTESYELNRYWSNPLNTSFALLNRADMLARLGRYADANKALDELKPFLNQLSDDNKYGVIWSAWSYLIRAQMSLGDGRPDDAKAHCQEALRIIATGRMRTNDPKAAVNTEVAVKATLGLAHALSGNSRLGLHLCHESITLAAANQQRSTDDADVRLILAEVLLEIGKAKEALDTVQLVQRSLALQNRFESTWRLWLIAARASDRLGDSKGLSNSLSNARTSLEELKSKWGTDSFSSYIGSVQMRRLHDQMINLSAKVH